MLFLVRAVRAFFIWQLHTNLPFVLWEVTVTTRVTTPSGKKTPMSLITTTFRNLVRFQHPDPPSLVMAHYLSIFLFFSLSLSLFFFFLYEVVQFEFDFVSTVPRYSRCSRCSSLSYLIIIIVVICFLPCVRTLYVVDLPID